MSSPRFVIYCGPMMSSKTTRLIAAIERYRFKNKKVFSFKPKLDSRYTPDEICTHSGSKINARVITSGSDITRCVMLDEPDVIAVDEAFMIDGVADALIDAYRRGVTVLVSTIELSSSCNVFAEVEKMLPWATEIEKCTAVCVVCGDDAQYTHRKVDNLGEIAVGGAELYEPRCWLHHATARLQ